MRAVHALRAASAGAVIAVGWMVGRGLFPSGADLANVLYYGRLMTEGSLPPYPPLAPATGALAWLLAGGDWDAALAMVRVLPALALGALVVASHRCLLQWGHAASIAEVGALLVATSGPLWFAAAWGAVPMLLGYACALCAAASWAHEREARRPWRTTAWISLSLLASPYPATFAALATIGLSIRHRKAAGLVLRRQGRWLLVPAGVAIVVYLLLLPAAKPGTSVGVAGPAAGFGMLAAQAGVLVPWAWFTLAALAIALASRVPAPVPAVDLDWLAMVAGVAIGALALQTVTVMNIVGRMLYALAILLPLAAAVHLRWPKGGHPAAWRRTVVAAVFMASLALPFQAAEMHEAAAYYRPPDGLAAVIEVVPPGKGGIAVYGGDPPTLESWWLRAGTGRSTWTGGDAWPHTFLPDLERNQAARTWMQGTAWVRLGDAVLGSGGCTGTGLRLSSQGLLHGTPLAVVPDATTGFAAQGPPPDQRPRWQAVADDLVDGADGEAAWSRTIRVDGEAFVVSWEGPDGAGWHTTWEAPPGAAFDVAEIDGGHRIHVMQAGTLTTPTFRVWPSPGAQFFLDPAGHWFRLAWDGSPPSLRVAVDGAGHAQGTGAGSRAGALQANGLDFVYVGHPQAFPGLDRDRSLAVHASTGDTALYRVTGAHACPAAPHRS